MLLFDMHADFFGRFDLQRNRYIRSGELFELSSILLLSRCWRLVVVVFEASRQTRKLLREQLKPCPIKK
jgi:hypothetical protein